MPNENNKFSKIIKKPWGEELIFTPHHAPHAGKILKIQAGKRLSLQYHDQKEETLCLLSGQANLWIGESQHAIEKLEMQPEVGYHIKPMLVHRIEAVTDCQIVEASLPETGTTFRLDDDYKRPHETEDLRGQDNRGWNG